ncbi:MAG: molybdenum cofactor guanylyltransferase [Flavobacteriia bacterium]|nr:MAG: molybdenum cofactor guanylyltransferase [Flavobacteriia bacterium]
MSDVPELYGLALIGGQSTRMGHDKSMIDYHGIPQWQYAVKQLEPLVNKVFLSVRQGQTIDYANLIEDRYPGKGPFGALMTALETYPDKAFLVLATDLPYMTDDQLQNIVKQRDASKTATVFKGRGKLYSEPLAAIWEPGSLQDFKRFFSENIFKLQAVLKAGAHKTVSIDKHFIQNINSLQDFNQTNHDNKKKF